MGKTKTGMNMKLSSHGGKRPTTGGAVKQADIGTGPPGNKSASTSSSGGPHFGHLPSSYPGSSGGGAKTSKGGSSDRGGPTFSFLPSSYPNGTGKK